MPSASRAVPERCEVRGEVGHSGRPTPCGLASRFAVSVAGCSPLFVCAIHGKAMRKFWGAHYAVLSTALETDKAHAVGV